MSLLFIRQQLSKFDIGLAKFGSIFVELMILHIFYFSHDHFDWRTRLSGS